MSLLRPHSILTRGVLAAMAACGGDDGSGIDGGSAAIDAGAGAIDGPGQGPDGATGMLALTSTALTEGGIIAAVYSCQGANISPPLAWTGGPSAPGYAVVLTDLSNGLIHSIIWDIGGDVRELPENVAKMAEPPVPAGSKQPLAYDNSTRGYLGPCPGSTHTYQFKLIAVDARPLPGVTLASNRAAVAAALGTHEVASATLSSTFTP